MKLFTFETDDGSQSVGTFLENEVIDLVAVGRLFSPSCFEKVRSMRDLLELEDCLNEITSVHEKIADLKSNNAAEFEKIRAKTVYSKDAVTLLAPIANPRKIICLGRNYAAHAKEGGKEPPKKPMIWGKFATAIIGPEEQIILPALSEKVDVEAELIVVIGKKGRFISPDDALDYVAGYTIGNDVSARDIQYSDKQYTRSKTFDTFAPLGPWIVLKEEIPDPHNLDIKLAVNGREWQSSNTKYMIFTVDYIVSFLSQAFTLEPGDLIFTGTPEGVGHYQDPPVYIKSGDAVTISIQEIGELKNPVK